MSPEYDILTQNTRNNLACITLNNMGCFYKKLNFNKVALQHFELVLKLENSLGADTVSKVETMLNICANLSNQNKHKDALKITQKCLTCLENELQLARENEITQNSGRNAPPERKGTRQEANFLKKQNLKTNLSSNFWSTLQITHFNMAVELEHLGRLGEAITAFKKAREISKSMNLPNLDLMKVIDRSIEEIVKKLANTMKFKDSRREKRYKSSIQAILPLSKPPLAILQLRKKAFLREQNDIKKLIGDKAEGSTFGREQIVASEFLSQRDAFSPKASENRSSARA